MSDPIETMQDTATIEQERIVQQAVAGRRKRKKLLPKDTPVNIAPSKIAAACGAAMLKRAEPHARDPLSLAAGFQPAGAPDPRALAAGISGAPAPELNAPAPKSPGWQQLTGAPEQYGKAFGALGHGQFGEAAKAMPWQGYAAMAGIPALLAYMHHRRKQHQPEEEKYGMAIGAPAGASLPSVGKTVRNASYGAAAGGFTPTVKTDSSNGWKDSKSTKVASQVLAYPELCSVVNASK